MLNYLEDYGHRSIVFLSTGHWSALVCRLAKDINNLEKPSNVRCKSSVVLKEKQMLA